MWSWKGIVPVVLLSGLAFAPLDAPSEEGPVTAAWAGPGDAEGDAPGARLEVPFRFEAAARDPLFNISTHVGDDPTFDIQGRPVNMLVEIAWECLGLCPLRITLYDQHERAVTYLEGPSPLSVYVEAPDPGVWTVDLSTVQAGGQFEGLVRVTTTVEADANAA